MQEANRFKIYSGCEQDSSYATMSLDEDFTAEMILSAIAPRLFNIHAEHFQDFALFIIILNSMSSLRERMLAPFECPIKIKNNSPPSFDLRFVIKRIVNQSQLIDENLPTLDASRKQDIIREGGLKIKGTDEFKDRYFVLDRNCIYFGHRKTVNKLFTRINLESISIRESNERLNGKYCFELVTTHKVYILKANNTEDKKKWMQIISRQSKIVAENKIFEDLNERIRKHELNNAKEMQRHLEKKISLQILHNNTEGLFN